MTGIEGILRTGPVIPVLVIDDLAQARPLAEALVAGGLRVLEVTLRTSVALDAIHEMKQVAGAIVGAGSVVSTDQFEAVREAGVEFIVSPGLAVPLAQRVIMSGIPYLPGIATAGDIMRGLDLGLTSFKFFPAQASGGIPALRDLSAPFGQCRFCPTGGITPATAPDWLALDCVSCVGGSWVATGSLAQVTAAARQALTLAKLSVLWT